jgi:hypothetical protein
MIINALWNLSINDFSGTDFFNNPETDNPNSLLGNELINDNEALSQWRRTMNLLNHNRLSPSH